MAERPFQPVPNTPLVDDPTGDSIWKRWLQGLQHFLSSAVRGPGSSTDNAVARWDGTTGTFLNNSGVIIDDSNNVTGVVALTATGTLTMSGTAANIALGSNFISNGGTDAGLSFNGSNNATFSGSITSSTLTSGRIPLVSTAGLITDDSDFTWFNSGGLKNIAVSGSNSAATNIASTNSHSTGPALLTTSLGSSSGGDGLFRAYKVAASGYATGWQGSDASWIVCDLDMFAVKSTVRLKLTSTSSFITNASGSALATNATDGFTYIPSCAGTPTGAPTAVTGAVPIAVDSTNNKLYFYSGSAWQWSPAQQGGTGAPNNANGNDGDFYFRSDGGVLTTIYHKRAGAWVGVV